MSNVHVLAGKYRPLGYQQLTVSSTAVTLTVPEGARLALISCEDDAVRWRDDGTNPTAAVGMGLTSGKELSYSGNLAAITFIRQTTDAELNISYYA